MKYLLLLGCLFAFSCQNKPRYQPHNRKFENIPIETADAKSLKPSNAKPIVYNIPDTASEHYLDSLIESVDYLQLETNNECLISNVDDLLFVRDLIVVVDRYTGKTVFVFDKQGKFLYKLTSSEVGTNSFSRILDVSVDETAGLIMVSDDKNSIIFNYDLAGKLVEKKKIGLRFKEFINIDKDRKLLFTAGLKNDHLPSIENYSVFILQDGKEVEYKDFYVDPVLADLSYYGKSHISHIENNYYFFPRFSDTVYKILPTGEVMPAYKFNIGRHMPKEFLYNDLNRKMFRSKVVEAKYNYFLGSFQENSSHIFTFMEYNQTKNAIAAVIVDKESGNAVNVESFKYNTKGIKYPGFSIPIGVKDNKFVAVLHNSLLKQYKKLSEDEKFKPVFASENVKSMYDQTQPNSNPIILSFTLKRF